MKRITQGVQGAAAIRPRMFSLNPKHSTEARVFSVDMQAPASVAIVGRRAREVYRVAEKAVRAVVRPVVRAIRRGFRPVISVRSSRSRRTVSRVASAGSPGRRSGDPEPPPVGGDRYLELSPTASIVVRRLCRELDSQLTVVAVALRTGNHAEATAMVDALVRRVAEVYKHAAGAW